MISECLAGGWNSVLFDASLPVEENLRQTIEVVAEARAVGADVEGEDPVDHRSRGRIGSDEVARVHDLDVALDFIARTGVDVFAPAIGNAHGRYRQAPALDAERVTRLTEASGVPMALHGGSGLSAEQFSDLHRSGCAKVNISTALKEVFMQQSLAHLEGCRDGRPMGPSGTLRRCEEGGDHHDARAHLHVRKRGAGMTLQAIIFDCDGVLADTERDGHRPAFNHAFAEFGVPVQWGIEEYGSLLEIGGGKERMATLFDGPLRGSHWDTGADDRTQTAGHLARREDPRLRAAGEVRSRSGQAGE